MRFNQLYYSKFNKHCACVASTYAQRVLGLNFINILPFRRRTSSVTSQEHAPGGPGCPTSPVIPGGPRGPILPGLPCVAGCGGTTVDSTEPNGKQTSPVFARVLVTNASNKKTFKTLTTQQTFIVFKNVIESSKIKH